MIVKRNGSREKFDRKKVLNGLIKACEKRVISFEDIENVVDDIELKFQNSLAREVTSEFIGEQCMEFLKRKDEVAYIRFASVYRQFKDVSEFMDELKTFLKSN